MGWTAGGCKPPEARGPLTGLRPPTYAPARGSFGHCNITDGRFIVYEVLLSPSLAAGAPPNGMSLVDRPRRRHALSSTASFVGHAVLGNQSSPNWSPKDAKRSNNEARSEVAMSSGHLITILNADRTLAALLWSFEEAFRGGDFLSFLSDPLTESGKPSPLLDAPVIKPTLE